jgi:hypothetical protein
MGNYIALDQKTTNIEIKMSMMVLNSNCTAYNSTQEMLCTLQFHKVVMEMP